MELNSKLTKFQSEVGAYVATLESSKQSLIDDVSSFEKLNSSANDMLSSSFKSNGADLVTAELEYITTTISKIKESLETELSNVINRCKSLNDKIENELKPLLDKCNEANNKYVSASSDDPNKSSLLSTLNSCKSVYNAMETELIKEHDAIVALDDSFSILADYGTASNDDSLLNVGYAGIEFSSIYFEKDGVIYQKLVPICEKGNSYTLDESYTIIYDKNKLLKVAGNNKYTQELFAFLNARLNGKKTNQYLWDYSANKYGSDATSKISVIMNQILQDTYKANNAQTIPDYAALAAIVSNSSAVHFGYSSNSNECEYGFAEVLSSGGDLDCIGLVRWCYSQGMYETGAVKTKDGKAIKKYMLNGSSMSPYNLLLHHSYSIKSMSLEQRANIPVGSVLSRPCYTGNEITNYHVGIVIGHTTDASGNPALVVTQSSNRTIGANNRVYTLKDLATVKNTWTNVSTPEMMNTRVLRGSTSETRLA